MKLERPRSLEIEGPPLDASAIVIGATNANGEMPDPPHTPDGPVVLWQGSIESDGTGPQKSYFVRLYADGSATCQCPAFYFRATLRRDPRYACKHVQRARMRIAKP